MRVLSRAIMLEDVSDHGEHRDEVLRMPSVLPPNRQRTADDADTVRVVHIGFV